MILFKKHYNGLSMVKLSPFFKLNIYNSKMTKTADKVILYLGKNKDMTKTKLSKELGISRPTLDSKLKDNSFNYFEESMLKMLKIV
jgi:DNA-binding NtrC family response regulator